LLISAAAELLHKFLNRNVLKLLFLSELRYLLTIVYIVLMHFSECHRCRHVACEVTLLGFDSFFDRQVSKCTLSTSFYSTTQFGHWNQCRPRTLKYIVQWRQLHWMLLSSVCVKVIDMCSNSVSVLSASGVHSLLITNIGAYLQSTVRVWYRRLAEHQNHV